jgi:hypothetical protein
MLLLLMMMTMNFECRTLDKRDLGCERDDEADGFPFPFTKLFFQFDRRREDWMKMKWAGIRMESFCMQFDVQDRPPRRMNHERAPFHVISSIIIPRHKSSHIDRVGGTRV